MYKYTPRPKRYCYLIATADRASLPVAVFDQLVDVVNWLGCGWTTANQMVNQGKVYHGLVCEKVKIL